MKLTKDYTKIIGQQNELQIAISNSIRMVCESHNYEIESSVLNMVLNGFIKDNLEDEIRELMRGRDKRINER